MHHAHCAACSEEFDALRGVRRSLSAWRLPTPLPVAFGRKPRLNPLVGLAAAAGLILALGAAARLASVSLDIAAGPVHLRVGVPDAAGQMQALTIEHRNEIAKLQAQIAQVQAQPAALETQREAALLERVQKMLDERDSRQLQQVDGRVQSLTARADAQRRYDLARISAGLSYLDGKTGQHAARTSELMGYMLQASEKR
jgi:TolA-binding protein